MIIVFILDLPSILSGTKIGFIDPLELCFSEGRLDRRTGYRWRLNRDREIMNNIPDQFLPYKGIFDSTEEVFSEGRYNGTLFRFPLRTIPSELSQTLYSDHKVGILFESIIADAHLLLLFLQHLESIELYVREESEPEPRKIFQVKISLFAVKEESSTTQSNLANICQSLCQLLIQSQLRQQIFLRT